MNINCNKELSPWLWLWAPVILFIAIYSSIFINVESYTQLLQGELGLIELITPLLLLPAIASGIVILKSAKNSKTDGFYLWISLVTMGCIFFAGEEISWGQHLIGWETPEWLNEANDQQETNLHNMSSWFDQKPRLLLELLVIVTGILFPLIRKFRDTQFSSDDWKYWIYPSSVCFPAAVLVLISRLPDRLNKIIEIDWSVINIRLSEVQELYLAMFLMLYLLSIKKRLLDTK